MAETYKVLGQTRPAATTLTASYTVPAATKTTVSSIGVTNTGGGTATFRVSIAVGGAADVISQYFYYNVSLTKESTFSAVLGITLGAGDVIRVYSSSGSLNFHIFGVEIT